MRLKTICAALLASAAACLALTGTAAAAAAPTATATHATSITNTSAVINATVNPNGVKTNYTFEYGPTGALGTFAPLKYLGAGTKAKAVAYKISGLQSGTTYYYALVASSTSGTSTTAIVGFKTAGVTPAQATTGGATVISSSSATLTGVVNTQDTTSSYYFVYGTTTGYGLETAPVTVTPSTTPTAVSYTVSGLTPGATFHYALVAVNGPGNHSVGADATVEPFPDPAPAAKFVQYTTPKEPKHGPYVFTTVGHVDNNTSLTPDTLACTGTATASFYYGKKLIHRVTVPVGTTCQFATKTTFNTLPVKGLRGEKLLVYVRFSGNHYLKGVVLNPQTLTLGL